MIKRIHRSFLFCGVAPLCIGTAAAQANVISLNFASGQDYADGITTTASNFDLLTTDSAGVVPAVNWNNLHLANASVSNTGGATDVVDNTGSTTTADVTFQTNGTWNTGIAQTSGDMKMMTAHLDGRASGFGSPADPFVTVSSIPYSVYDVYVYFDSVTSAGEVKSNYTIGSQTFYIEDDGTFSGTFVLGSGMTVDDRSAANYVKFSGITGPSFTMTADSESFRAEVSGMQIIAVPEPASLSLLGLSALGLLTRRRAR